MGAEKNIFRKRHIAFIAMFYFIIVFYLIIFFFLVEGYCAESSEQNLEKKYFKTLDDWVSRGGSLEEIHKSVIETCGKLVMLKATDLQKEKFITTQREEFHFRVDVCAKTTVHRVHPQPEFENPEIISLICGDDNNPLFIKLCEKCGLK